LTKFKTRTNNDTTGEQQFNTVYSLCFIFALGMLTSEIQKQHFVKLKRWPRKHF